MYVPATHDVHAADPVTVLKNPASHGVHSTPSIPVQPAKQVQDTSVPLPSADNVLAGHARQVLIAIAVVAVEYVLAPHDVQSTDPVTDFHFPTPHAAQDKPS